MNFDGYKYHRIQKLVEYSGVEVWIADDHVFVNQGFDELELDSKEVDKTIGALRLARKALGKADHERKQERADFHAQKLIANLFARNGWGLDDGGSERTGGELHLRDDGGVQGRVDSVDE